MKIHLPLFLLFLSCLGFSQEDKQSIYFPQEQLIHPDCSDKENKNDCLKNTIDKKFLNLLKIATYEYGTPNDTLSVTASFEVNNRGNVIKERVFLNDSIIGEHYGNQLNDVIKKLPRFKVLNRKSSPSISIHKFYFEYRTRGFGGNIVLLPIKTTLQYEGGIIEEAPLFPGCKRGNEQAARQCFTKKVQEHIRKNFRYPEQAEEYNIQGRVFTMFTVRNDGSINNLRTRGPHPLLEKEAMRIVKLLPKFKPGTLNGKPVGVPFSIPIMFSLQ